MPIILETEVRGFKYYVQLYQGKWELNGLKDNAHRFQDKESLRVIEAEIRSKFTHQLYYERVDK